MQKAKKACFHPVIEDILIFLVKKENNYFSKKLNVVGIKFNKSQDLSCSD